MALAAVLAACAGREPSTAARAYNGPYEGPNLNRVAFPIGGIGAGMFCLEGTGAISHVSLRNRIEFFNEPCAFAAITVKGEPNVARVLEGPVPGWKIFGAAGTGNGASGASYGLPRFGRASFLARFPFATIALDDPAVPLDVTLTGWSPFIPGDADDSSLPVGGLEYAFHNPTGAPIEAMFSFNTKNVMAMGTKSDGIGAVANGFVLFDKGTEEKPADAGALAVFVDDPDVVVDHGWFRGGWWDALTLAWKNVQEARPVDNPPLEGPSPGASLFVPLTIEPGATKTVRLMLAWHVPLTDYRYGQDPEGVPQPAAAEACCSSPYHVPWYAGKFDDIDDLAEYWRAKYDVLRERSAAFRDAFYDTTLPPEVVEAAAANLTILKSPTVQRQADGRLWC
ncbi:MAG: hypothetical protein JW775_08510, partial [Candidatus Aminicenantes bacterium]|nr:hypothetical protein [Candidatus Aminicenantes bacterium]